MARRILDDLVRETTTSTGTGPFTPLGAAPGGFGTFAAADGGMVEGDTAPVVVRNVATGERLVCEMVMDGDGRLVPTEQIYSSSNVIGPGEFGLVDFGPGVKEIYISITAADYRETSISGFALDAKAARDEARLTAQDVETDLDRAPWFATEADLLDFEPDDGRPAILGYDNGSRLRGVYRRTSGAWPAERESRILRDVDEEVASQTVNFPDAVPIGGELDDNDYPGYLVYADQHYEFPGGIDAPHLEGAELRNTPVTLPDSHVAPVWADEAGNPAMGIDPRSGEVEIYATKAGARYAAGRISYSRETAYALLPSTAWASVALAGFQDMSPVYIRGMVWDRGRWTSVIINRAYRFSALDESVVVIEYCPSYGQSLNQGTSDSTVRLGTPVDPHNSLCFNTGTLGAFALTGDEALIAGNIYYLQPAHEALNVLRGLSESMGTAMMGSLSERELAADVIRGARLYIAHGKGGQTIAQLSKGTGWFDNGVTYAQKAKALSLSQFGKAMEFKCWHWEQGQADRGLVSVGSQTRSGYLTALQQLYADYDADIRVAVFAGSRAALMTIGQLTANGTVSSADDQLGASVISLAMLDAVEADATAGHTTAATQRYAITTADYMLQTTTYGYYAGGPHLYAGGYDIKGEYQAKVRDWVFRRGRWWTGLRPVGAPDRTGTTVTIDFYVPVPPLVFDTSTLPDFTQFSGSKGFVFRDSAGTVAITNAVITDDGSGDGIGRVTLTLGSTPTGVSETLEYAYLGNTNMTSQYRSAAWGNLRDSDNDPSKYVAGVTLWNWGLIWKKDVV